MMNQAKWTRKGSSKACQNSLNTRGFFFFKSIKLLAKKDLLIQRIKNRTTLDFVLETLEAGRQWSNTFRIVGGKDYDSYPGNRPEV